MSWEENVRKVEPYVAGEQPKDPSVIKLNTNECPYPPSPRVLEAVRKLEQETDRLRLYPDMDATPLVHALASKYNVSPDQIFVGVGSDDVLSMSFLTFFTSGKRLLFPNITYSFYDVWAELYRIPYSMIPLRDDWTIDPEDYLPGSRWYGDASEEGKEAHAEGKGAFREEKGIGYIEGKGAFAEEERAAYAAGKVKEQPVGGIIFPNPNAPTGVELPLADIERIVAANQDKVVIVDEAYVDFGAQSALPLIEKYENLLVVQTFSKSRAMAGARIGFAIGSPKLIGYLKDVKFSFNSYTMNLPSILLGTAAVEDDSYFHEITGKIATTRERFERELAELGFVFPESKANFVFARHPSVPGDELFRQLRERKIYVRHWDKPLIHDWLRITIGTDAQMDAVVNALKEFVYA